MFRNKQKKTLFSVHLAFTFFFSLVIQLQKLLFNYMPDDSNEDYGVRNVAFVFLLRINVPG